MILLMRNHANEFVPGCDLTLVRMDAALVGIIADRARQCARAEREDRALAELRFWDPSPTCILLWVGGDVAEAVEQALEEGDGWAVLDDGALGPFEAAHADCTQMAISASSAPAISWSYRVGSEPIRTYAIPLDGLATKLGSPLGDLLCDLP